MAFERDDGFFLGAFVVNFGVVLGLLAAYIGVAVALTLPDPPVAALIVGGLAVAVVVPVAFYPFSRTVWSAIDLILKPLTEDPGPRQRGVTPGARAPRP